MLKRYVGSNISAFTPSPCCRFAPFQLALPKADFRSGIGEREAKSGIEKEETGKGKERRKCVYL